MDQFRLDVRTDNAAFDEGIATELGRILREVADRLDQGDAGTSGKVFDSNGNSVGSYAWGPVSER